jgi:hypothetical protein
MRIGPGERRVVAVEFDSSTEHDFVGRLSIDLIGYAQDAIAFHTIADLEVQPDGVGRPEHLVDRSSKETRP